MSCTARFTRTLAALAGEIVKKMGHFGRDPDREAAPWCRYRAVNAPLAADP
jgi:hypothetical protein